MTLGLIGEFARPDELVNAAAHCHAGGFRTLEAFTPMPIDALDPYISGRPGVALAAIMAGAGVIGAAAMWYLQYYGAAIDYPLNVGGRPLDSWAAFVPSAWEICALATVYAGFVAFLGACRLPRLFHPVFAVPNFARATQDRFFLRLEVGDDPRDLERARLIFQRDGAVAVSELAE